MPLSRQERLDSDMGLTPLPGTGPYRIASATPKEVVFKRNPYFREWSHAAQPEGNPAVIIWRTLPSDQAVVNAIARGKADWAWGSIPPPSLHALEVEDPVRGALGAHPLSSSSSP